MQEAKNLKEYKKELHESLDNEFLRATLDAFAKAYRGGREKAFADYDFRALVAEASEIKDLAAKKMDQLYEQFKSEAEKRGAVVHLAKTADEANEIIARIAKEGGVKKVVKSKSMTAEETHLNVRLEKDNLEVVETDLGEWIIQLRHEGPSHMVMPAIHLSRHQVKDLFSDVTKKPQEADIDKLVKVARSQLRRKFVEADMGISGANFAVAESGTIGIVTNEGNARMVSTLPRIHVALVGLDKLISSIDDAFKLLRVIPKNATGQAITSYVTWVTGATPMTMPGHPTKEIHYVFIDNGRRALASDPLFSTILRCVRCGACANVCPVYRLVGGHKLGHIYIGAIGLLLTYFFHGKDKAKNLVQNCIACGACKDICAGGIDLPRLIKDIHARIQEEDGRPLESRLLGQVLSNRKLFHTLLRSAKAAQKPVTAEPGFIRHLPLIFSSKHNFRALPTIAEKPFRDRFAAIKPANKPNGLKVAIFAGCAQDFIYPEQLEAAVDFLDKSGCNVEFPMDQSCCGLPVAMMGEKDAARKVALQNLKAFNPDDYDYILTLCASCASHLTHGYKNILAGDPTKITRLDAFTRKVVDFSTFINDVLETKTEDIVQQAPVKAAYHAPCHLCRELGVRKAPRDLLTKAGLEYVPTDEEEVCCGFGGSYSMKFPELSKELLNNKLNAAEAAGAEVLVTDCPGCVLQLRGGAHKQGRKIEVKHISEILGKK